jgi:hypothetical protein
MTGRASFAERLVRFDIMNEKIMKSVFFFYFAKYRSMVLICIGAFEMSWANSLNGTILTRTNSSRLSSFDTHFNSIPNLLGARIPVKYLYALIAASLICSTSKVRAIEAMSGQM